MPTPDSAKLHQRPTLDERARRSGLCRRQLAYGDVVVRHGSPELCEAVDAGRVALYRAARIARSVPPEEQLEAALRHPYHAKRARSSTPNLDAAISAWQKMTDAERFEFREFLLHNPD